MAIPLDQNINNKTAEKLTKYKELKQEMIRMYDLQKTEIIPIIIGALGTTTQGLPEYTRRILPQANLDIMVKTALLGTAHIIRNFFT